MSLRVSVADSAPFRLGLKVTLIVQLALAASALEQLFVWGKSLAFAPPTLIPEMPSGPGPLFESVTACAVVVVPTATLPKPRVEGAAVAVGETPVPVREAVCGLPAALSVTVRKPARAPPAVGVNVTLIVQVAPAAIAFGAIGQLFAWAKSPLVVTELMTSGPVPEFVTIKG